MARTAKEIKTVRKTIAMPLETAELLEKLAGGAYHRGDFLAAWLPRIETAMAVEAEIEQAAAAAGAKAAAAERDRRLAQALIKPPKVNQ
jgi:hypothetical protein